MPDHYEILGVSRSATSAEVRQTYLRLAKERHPDRFLDPAEKERAQEFFKQLTTAFNTLSNDRNRKEYDLELERPKVAVPEEIARDAFARGVKKFEERDYHEAVTLLRVAVEHAPGEARYHAALGRALAKNPHWIREAIGEVEKATQLAPRGAAFHAELATLLFGQGLKLRARKAAEAAVRLAPEDPEVLRVMAEVGLAETEENPSEEGGGPRGLLRRKP